MLCAQRDSEVGNLLLEFDQWQVREMVLTPTKVDALWMEFQKYPTLFSDLTAGNYENFVRMLSQPDSFWVEVWDGDVLVGLLYAMELSQIIDAEVHILFFDRKTNNKIALCREMLRWLFRHFRLHRITSQIPDIYHATIRLAERTGMKREGVRRESILIGGQWRDQILFGLLASELD